MIKETFKHFLEITIKTRTTLQIKEETLINLQTEPSYVKNMKVFGHYLAECPNFLKKQKRSLTATLSNDGSNSNSSDEENNPAFISSVSINDELESTPENSSVITLDNDMTYNQLYRQ